MVCFKSVFWQEGIPVGCVPPSAVAVWGGVSTPPGQIPLNFPLVWAWRPPPWPDPPQLPPWQWAWKCARDAGILHPPRSRHPPPWTEFLTHACENIALPQTSFAGGNYVHQEFIMVLRMTDNPVVYRNICRSTCFFSRKLSVTMEENKFCKGTQSTYLLKVIVQ